MPGQANAVEDYLKTTRPTFRWRESGGEKAELVRKAFAQQLARAATRTVNDRHSRAEVRIAVYNHVTPLLEQHHKAIANLHRFYRKLLLITFGALALAIALIVVLLA